MITRRDGTTIRTGEYKSHKQALEHIVELGLNLKNADLQKLDLTNITLDETDLEGADFNGSNLTGANLSDANLTGAIMDNCDLYNTCLAHSNMTDCSFKNTNFGATDITGANISNTHFSTLSCFSLNFATAKTMDRCHFTNTEGQTFIFSKPPIAIYGHSDLPLVFLEKNALHGHTAMTNTAMIGTYRQKG